MNRIYDVAIVGGGIAGLSLASSLLHSPCTRHLSVVLIEATKHAKFDRTSPISNRTSSLTRSSIRYLQSSTAWDHVLPDRTLAYSDMHVCDGVSDQQIEFQEAAEIATMVENFNLQSGILSALRETHVDLRFARVNAIDRPEAGQLFPTIQLDNTDKITARLLVGADGANSPVRAYANIASHGWDYPHHGLVGTLSHESPNYATAHQRMLPSGPIAFLPLPDQKASMVWSIHPRYATTLKSLDEETLAKFVNAAFRLSYLDLKYILNLPVSEIVSELDWRLSLPSHSKHAPPQVSQVSNAASFPLRFRHTDTYHGDRAVLIGDAAHTIHPLAGQGLNLALSDSASLQKAIEDCVGLGGDIGTVGAQVSRDRYWANARVGGVVDKLHKLYAREEPVLVGLRSLGSGLLDKIEVAKRAMMASVG